MTPAAVLRWSGGLALRLPRGASYWIASRIADATFALWPRRAIIIQNMARIVEYTGDARSPVTLGRQALRNYAWYMTDFLRAYRVREADLEGAVDPAEWQRFVELARSGRGVIVAGMHTGNWDYAGFIMNRSGLPFFVVADRLKPPAFDRFVQERRQALGMTTIPVDQAARGMLRALRQGKSIGILVDRPVGPAEGVPVTFFGETCYLPSGAAALALRTGAKIVPAGMRRSSDGGYKIDLDFSIETEPTGDQAVEARALMQKIVSCHERWIAMEPEQWYMFRRMWGDGPRKPLREQVLVETSR